MCARVFLFVVRIRCIPRNLYSSVHRFSARTKNERKTSSAHTPKMDELITDPKVSTSSSGSFL